MTGPLPGGDRAGVDGQGSDVADASAGGWRERARRRQRRILLASLGIAALVHALVFLVAPRIQFSVANDPIFGEDVVRRFVLGGMSVDFLFGPPRIQGEGGTEVEAPPERVLEARDMGLGDLEVHPTCADSFRPDLPPWEGSVRLQVGRRGLVTVMGIERSSGDRCADAALLTAAAALWYRWLPSDEFPAPVELVQPMQVVASPVDEGRANGAPPS